MNEVFYFSVPLSGHVNPCIELCKELSERGIQMVYYTSKEIFRKLEHIPNIQLREYPKSFQDYFEEIGNRRELHHKMLFILSTFYRDMELLMDFCIHEIEKKKPKLVICDQFALWGKAAARFSGIPYCLFFSSIMGDSIATEEEPFLKASIVKMVVTQFPSMIDIIRVIGRLKKKYGNVIDDINSVMTHNGVFTAVMTSKEFHPGGHKYPANVRFIGGDHTPDVPMNIKKDTIFISLGTVSLRKNFFEDCIDASKDLGFNIVITLAGNTEHKINPEKITDEVIIYDNLNFQEYRNVVNQAALFISHGGFNGITTALLYNTPVLVCPSSSEQVNNGKLIEKYHCGKGYYKKDIHVPDMRHKIIDILSSKEVKKSVQFHGNALRQSKGYKKVAQEMCNEFRLTSEMDSI